MKRLLSFAMAFVLMFTAVPVSAMASTHEHSNKTAEKQTLLFLRRYKKKKMISETNRHERNQNTLGK